MSRFALFALQTAGVLLLLFCFAVSFVPAYNMNRFLASTSTYTASLLLPFVPIVWFATLSLLVAGAKWAIIGTYKPAKIPVPSIAFVRWWFVDRLVHLWEIWVGSLAKGTPIIWLFYKCLGAKIHPSARINAFVREFDLVDIGAYSSLSADITCR